MRMKPALFVVMWIISLGGCGGTTITQLPKQTSSEVVEAQSRFTYKGKPIPPFFLADFCGGPDVGDFWMKGMGARIAAVAVEGLFYEQCDGSYSGCAIEQGEFVRFNLHTDSQRAGWFSYKFLGTTPSGVTVLEYTGNTGGSGTVLGVIFLRFELETIGFTEAGRQERLVMRFLGEETWGDRVYRDVKLMGNEFILGPERSDLPCAKDSLEPARTISVK